MDFSVLWSSRKDCFCLLLGPARFVNVSTLYLHYWMTLGRTELNLKSVPEFKHDCRNNVEFMPIGAHMKFKVVEPIMANEQIFTRYGESASFGLRTRITNFVSNQVIIILIQIMLLVYVLPVNSK